MSFFLFFLSFLPLQDRGRDLAALLEGVEKIARPGVPGPLVVFGPEAFPVFLGRNRRGTVFPVVAAARFGRGRVLAFGHGGYFGRKSLRTADTGQLCLNGIAWASAGKTNPRIGLLGGKGLASFLREEGIDFRTLDPKGLSSALKRLDLLLGQPPAGAEEAVRAFLRKGGGLLIAGLGWGWKQLHPGRDLPSEHPGNRLLGPLGLAWGDGFLHETPARSRLQGGNAWKALLALEEGKVRGASRGEGKQGSALLAHAARWAPLQARPFFPRLRTLLSRKEARALPAPERPLGLDRPLARLALVLRWREERGLPPSRIRPAPEARDFPGAPPPSAPRRRVALELDLSRPGWIGTGLFAPPGEVVRVKASKAASTPGLWLRIGCHSDRLWEKPSWKRHPEISRRFRLDGKEREIASPWGGLIYLERTGKGGSRKLRLSFEGVVEAPRFVLGRTTPEDWRRRIRKAPGPWAELETSKIILTLPSARIRDLEDPEALMRFWDRVLDCYGELGMRPLSERPQRIVTDVQISAGYMHAGYPVMTHLDQGRILPSLKALKGTGNGVPWGLWHELGHNHQQRDWTFGGTTEVTCNLFTVYVLEKISGIRPGESRSLQRAKTRIRKHLAKGAPFEAWKKDPFLALWMYLQVQRAFGWEPFQKVFAGYRSLREKDRPKSDAEKRDQWLLRLSRAVGRDLGPFFERWGVPTTKKARDSLKGLDPWLPGSFREGREGGDQAATLSLNSEMSPSMVFFASPKIM